MEYSTCDISCKMEHCHICKSQSISQQEFAHINLAMAKAKLEYAKNAYNDLDILLQTAKSKLICAYGEYKKAVKKAKDSLK